jgi:hypothetical protein
MQDKPKPPFPEQHQERPGHSSYITGEVLTLLGGDTTAA